ncbi:hypothetical protein LZ24_01098 [Desulfobotulus alkaliphilus]|uniref:PAS domain-containing protein n=1 Tax=Desulfobotulus alkaliphilus TaxID=622671 RepID=A0A562RZ20_9BACT|nr:PAS domain-containing protein [Desulfobotulus alkaliphilus]TWI74158.1 hypothetical protein LZ24_01098 [Desulfobotulus alkaliphilus]
MKPKADRSSHGIWAVDFKITISFIAMVSIILCVGMAGFGAVSMLQTSLKNFGENRIPDLKALAVLNQHRMAIRGDTFAVSLLLHEKADAKAYGAIRVHQQEAWKYIDEAWLALRTNPRQSEKGIELIRRAEADYDAWRSIHRRMDTVLQQLADPANSLRQTELHHQYMQLTAEALPLSNTISLTFDGLTDNNIANTSAMVERSLGIAGILHKGAVFSLLLGTGISIFLFILSHRARQESARQRWIAHQDLERRRANLQAIFDTAPVGMILLNGEGKVRQINPVVSGITGMPGSCGMFRQIGEFLNCIHAHLPEKGCGYRKEGPCGQCRIRAALECALEARKEIRGVESAHTLSIHGRTENFFFQISAAPLFLDGSNHVLLTLFDITDHKETEAELRSSNMMLEKTIAHASNLARKAALSSRD